MGVRSRDGTHPDADLIYNASLNVTPPSDAIRRQFALRVVGDRVEVAPDAVSAFDPNTLPHLLAELVHQSGWTWQGIFFDWQGGCR